jgi:hypothetical protein
VQVDRRRAERARAAQLNMLSPEDRQLQLAKELHTAMDSAKKAKATGNKKHKEVAGEVIRHIKLEITSLGIKEADIHKLISEHFKPAEVPEVKQPPQQSRESAHNGAPDDAGEAETVLEDATEQQEIAVSQEASGGGGRDHIECAQFEVQTTSEEVQALATLEDAAATDAYTHVAEPPAATAHDEGDEFDANVLWYSIPVLAYSARALPKS